MRLKRAFPVPKEGTKPIKEAQTATPVLQGRLPRPLVLLLPHSVKPALLEVSQEAPGPHRAHYAPRASTKPLREAQTATPVLQGRLLASLVFVLHRSVKRAFLEVSQQPPDPHRANYAPRAITKKQATQQAVTLAQTSRLPTAEAWIPAKLVKQAQSSTSSSRSQIRRRTLASSARLELIATTTEGIPTRIISVSGANRVNSWRQQGRRLAWPALLERSR